MNRRFVKPHRSILRECEPALYTFSVHGGGDWIVELQDDAGKRLALLAPGSPNARIALEKRTTVWKVFFGYGQRPPALPPSVVVAEEVPLHE